LNDLLHNLKMKLFLLGIFFFFLYFATKAHFLYRQLPTPNRQLPTANRQPSTANRLPPIANRLPPTANRQPPTINRTAYYKAMELNNKDLVNGELAELKTAPDEIRDAFTGAMLMKKASFTAAASTKLHLFRQGHKMLEDAIKKDPDNVEFRFLRLIIQEHAPGILGYKNDLQKDSDQISKSYKSLPEDVQQIMIDYSKKSKFLKLEVS
jgi:hypothetical protein